MATVLVLAGCGTNPQKTALYSDLWMQTSAEYRALCLQTYTMAERRLSARVAELGGQRPKPLAVVLDLDETVLDNTGSFTWLYFNRKTFSSETFAEWAYYQAGLEEPKTVPGALEFLARMNHLGVTPVFITNRREALRQPTITTLRHLQLDVTGLENTTGSRLLMRTSERGKEARRDIVRRQYEIIAYVGDNLADFSVVFEAGETASAEMRDARVEEFRTHWGADWFVLPNPVYGDWVTALGGEPGPNDLIGPRYY